tara:strand:- start:567 stop:1073 length:507 start_codon:yes stop_codon:yes gene_type:complete
LAPIISFTAEEAWLARGEDSVESIHLRRFPEIPETWRDEHLAEKWSTIRRVRRVVTGALEVERSEKRIGSSLESAPIIFLNEDTAGELEGIDLAEVTITSSVTIKIGTGPQNAFTLEEVPGVFVLNAKPDGSRCERCWQFLPDVGMNNDWPDTCGRCAGAVKHFAKPE